MTLKGFIFNSRSFDNFMAMNGGDGREVINKFWTPVYIWYCIGTIDIINERSIFGETLNYVLPWWHIFCLFFFVYWQFIPVKVLQCYSNRTYVDIRAGPESVTGAPFFSFPKEPDRTVGTGKILWQLHVITLRSEKLKSKDIHYKIYRGFNRRDVFDQTHVASSSTNSLCCVTGVKSIKGLSRPSRIWSRNPPCNKRKKNKKRRNYCDTRRLSQWRIIAE